MSLSDIAFCLFIGAILLPFVPFGGRGRRPRP